MDTGSSPRNPRKTSWVLLRPTGSLEGSSSAANSTVESGLAVTRNGLALHPPTNESNSRTLGRKLTIRKVICLVWLPSIRPMSEGKPSTREGSSRTGFANPYTTSEKPQIGKSAIRARRGSVIPVSWLQSAAPLTAASSAPPGLVTFFCKLIPLSTCYAPLSFIRLRKKPRRVSSRGFSKISIRAAC